MVERPSDLLARYVEAGAFRLIVHAEATAHLHRVLAEIRRLGVECGVALNPGSPLTLVEEVAADADLLLLMTVDPGFGGQALLAGGIAGAGIAGAGSLVPGSLDSGPATASSTRSRSTSPLSARMRPSGPTWASWKAARSERRMRRMRSIAALSPMWQPSA